MGGWVVVWYCVWFVMVVEAEVDRCGGVVEECEWGCEGVCV